MKRDYKVFMFPQSHCSENMVHVEHYHGTAEGQVAVTLHFGLRGNSAASTVDEICGSRQEAARLLRKYHRKLHTRHLPW